MLKIFKECFSTNLNEYDKINVDLEINKIVLGVSLAMIVGIILFNLYRYNIKLLVSQLTRHGAKNEDSAKTLSELGINKTIGMKRMLTGDTFLTKIVARSGEKKYDYEEYKLLTKDQKKENSKIDLTKERFYIKEDKESALLAQRVNEWYGISVFNTVISCIFTAVICACIIACMPGILNFINKMI